MEALLDDGTAQKEVAKILDVDPSTISRERKRKKKGARKYRARIAQEKADTKRRTSKYRGMAVESDTKRKEYIMKELEAHRSPDEIAGRIALEKRFVPIGKDAIYRWLYSSRGNLWAHHLCTRRRKKKPQRHLPKREMIPDRRPLEMRPEQGIHAQGDTFVSPRHGSGEAGVMVVVPDSQLLLGTKVTNLSPATMVSAFARIIRGVSMDDCTFDNGIENRHHMQFPVPAYFCDPHAPWQKPDVENNIGLVRRWFVPKGTDLVHVSEQELQGYVHTLNGKYRKSLGYRSAYEDALVRGIIDQSFVEERTLAARKHTVTRVAFGVRI